MPAFRALLLLVAVTCTAAFSPAAPRAAVQLQQRGAAISMVTAATKPQRVNKRNREYNKVYKSEMRTRIKRVRARHRRFPVVRRTAVAGALPRWPAQWPEGARREARARARGSLSRRCLPPVSVF